MIGDNYDLAVPGAARCRRMAVYELVDVTGDDVYWSLGLFESVELAEECIRYTTEKDGQPPRSEMCDGCRVDLELRRREFGPGDSHKTIWRRSWIEEVDESNEQFVWVEWVEE